MEPADTIDKTSAEPAQCPASRDALLRSIRAWLPTYCQSLPRVARAIAVTTGKDGHGYEQVAAWPAGFAGKPQMLEMAAVGFSGRSKAQCLRDSNGTKIDRIAMPITRKGRCLGALVLEADKLKYQHRRELYAAINGKPIQKTSPDEAASHRRAIVLDLLAECLDQPRAADAAQALVTGLALRSGCDRVTLGRLNRFGELRLESAWGPAQDKNSAASLCLLNAIREAIAQDRTLVYRGQEPGETPRHAGLSDLLDGAQLLTVLLRDQGDTTGAIMLERHGNTGIGAGLVELAEMLAALAGPVLALKFREDQSLVTMAGDSARRLIDTMWKPQDSAAALPE